MVAPAGWHCFRTYGSGGETIWVTPESLDSGGFFPPKRQKLIGPAVMLSHLYGGTSGRFAVARIAARLFPSAAPYVQRVMDEDIAPKSDFTFGPFPNDQLKSFGDQKVAFTTPAGFEGIGTVGWLASGDQPIRGLVILLPDHDMDLVMLDVRLPSGLTNLASTIVRSAASPAFVEMIFDRNRD